MRERHRISTLVLALLLAACSPAQQGDGQAASSPSPDRTQAELARFNADGPLPAAREASTLEFWLHYKLMQATGMEQALGGEEQAVAALKAMGMAFERSARVVQAEVPRMLPASFDGTGIDAGMMGAGYGLVGGALSSSLLNGGLSNEQIAEAARNGPIKLDGKDGSVELGIAQDSMDTTLEQTVNENGVTGKVKTQIHIDACPDAQGKLMVTIETQSNMGAGGKSGAVTLRYRQERALDDDARLLPLSDGGHMNGSEYFQIGMKGTGANGELSYYEDAGTSSDGKATGGTQEYSGYSIFRPEEAAHTTKMVQGTQNLMRAFAEMMMQGSFSGGTPPWESGRCVDLKVRSSPEKRKGARPNTAYSVFAEPRAKKDGMPAGGTVKATLNGGNTLNPRGKVKADAQFDYQNPEKKDQSASIDFEARSKRGVGKATMEFDTKRGGYRIDYAICPGGGNESARVCDITKPFSSTFCDGMATVSHTPGGDKGGTWTMRFSGAGGSADSSGDYSLSGPEGKMTARYSAARTCARAAGMSICTTSKPATATWTKIDDCEE